MEALRVAARLAAPTPALSWREDDPVADWTIKLGTLKEYRVHSAVVGSGERRSDKIRGSIVEKNGTARTTDIATLLPEAARAAIISDPHVQATFELMLDWQYGLVDALALPTFAGKVMLTGVAAQPTSAVASVAIDRDGTPAGAGTAAEPGGENGESVLGFFQTALFGAAPNATPSKSGSTGNLPAAAATPSVAAPATPAAASRAAKVVAPQVPLLWSLADCLQVRGLKTALLSLFEDSPLAPNYVMNTPAYERLKMLVRALELHCTEVVAALREQLRLASLTEGLAALAVAASACDLHRYEQLSRCGLLPPDDQALLAVLDQSTLRVGSEGLVYDLIAHHITATKANDAAQQALWSKCRFSFLDAERCVKLAENPNVPPRWIALALATRGATAPVQAAAAAVGTPAQAVRLQPREFYV